MTNILVSSSCSIFAKQLPNCFLTFLFCSMAPDQVLFDQAGLVGSWLRLGSPRAVPPSHAGGPLHGQVSPLCQTIPYLRSSCTWEWNSIMTRNSLALCFTKIEKSWWHQSIFHKLEQFNNGLTIASSCVATKKTSNPEILPGILAGRWEILSKAAKIVFFCLF